MGYLSTISIVTRLGKMAVQSVLAVFFKEQLAFFVEEFSVYSKDELDLAISAVCDSRNRYMNRSGSSPHQRKSARLRDFLPAFYRMIS